MNGESTDHDLLIRIDAKLDVFTSMLREHIQEDKTVQEKTLALSVLSDHRLGKLELRQAWLMGGGAALTVIWVVLSFFANWFRR